MDEYKILENKEDSKRATIIAVAFDIVTRYGYKRTTMDDIARAAGMSRPALYLFYKNKTDIFRACIEDFVGMTQKLVAASFEGDGAPVKQISDALTAGVVDPMRKIMGTPHGAELLELKNLIADDLGEQWIRMIETEVAKGLEKSVQAGHLALPGNGMTLVDIASSIVDAAEGVKHRNLDPDAMETRIRNLVALMITPMQR